jgi:hypothetical protein
MKIIFSRKGFDSKYGGGCSPILPDGRLLSIPIPSISIENGIPYSKLISPFGTFKNIMEKLKLKIPENGLAHLDPDLIDSVYERNRNWKGIFGQAGAANSHLSKENIEKNDIFLFYSSFRKTAIDNNKNLTFCEKEIRHIIFGYLLVDEIINNGKYQITDFIKSYPKYKWAFYHPHLINDKYGKQNTIYVAKENFNDISGYGTFYYDTTSINGKLIFTIFSALAEHERDIIRERTKAGLEAARARGRLGGRPKGLSKTSQMKAHAAADLYSKNIPILDIMSTLEIGSKATLYRYLRIVGIKILGTKAY